MTERRCQNSNFSEEAEVHPLVVLFLIVLVVGVVMWGTIYFAEGHY